jgi:outer membrane receptor protein involved in Fe transport
MTGTSCSGLRTGGATRLARLMTTTCLIAFGGAGAAIAQQPAAEPPRRTVDVITVTAQKREESLQDVPLSIQAIDSTRIQNLGISQFEDIVAFAPSVSFVSERPGTQNLFIRGIADGSNPNRTNTATATLYLDEQPLTVGGTIIDLHSYDIERFEVLNGPQGTYYGAGSVSGTVRIITNKPDPSGYEAGFDATVGTIENGGEIYTLEGFANIPIVEDRVAIRLVGWYDEQGGFVDNIPLTRTYTNGAVVSNAPFVQEDYNTSEITGGRVSLRADLTPNWTGKLSAFYQSADTTGAWDHDPRRRGDLQVARFAEDSGSREFSQYAGTLEGSTDFADIVLTTSYFSQDYQSSADYSDYVEYASFAPWIQQFACDQFYYYGNVGCNDPSMAFSTDNYDERWSTEIRATSNGDGPLSWIVGAYFESNQSEGFGIWEMPGIKFGGAPAAFYLSYYGGTPLPSEWYSYYGSGDSEQIAVFGEVGYDITDRLTLTVGARLFEDSFSSDAGGWSNYFYEAKTGGAASSGDSSGEGFKFNLQYRISDNLLTYFNFAQGFRAGGSNGAIGQTNPNIPEVYDPDYLDSYEAGWKAQLLDGRLIFNGAVYRMIWEDFQTSIYDINIAPVIFYANAGNAEVLGFEADIQAQITDGWSFNFNANYNNSELTEDFRSLVDPTLIWAPEGRELPYVPAWKFSATTRYEFTVTDTIDGYIQAAYSYTDEVWNLLIEEAFQAGAVPERQDAYGTLDLRAGFNQGAYRLELFATNVTDERAEVFINTGYYDQRITTNRPRTLGVRLSARY